jgi:Flp pilus assembly protein TadD
MFVAPWPCRQKGNKMRNPVVPVVFAAIVGLPFSLPSQSPEKSLVEAGSLSTTSTTASTPTLANAEHEGDSLVAHQRYQAAAEAYSHAAEMTPTIWNKMGISYQMMFNNKEAMRCYKEAIHLDPHNSQYLNNLGTVYATLKQYGPADREYRKALKIDPRSALILKNLGTNLLSERKYSKGWEAYQQALAIDPQIFAEHRNPKVENPSNVQDRGAMNYYMALGCIRSGYTDSALQYLRAALDEGFTSRQKVAADAQFASLRANPGFLQLLAQ